LFSSPSHSSQEFAVDAMIGVCYTSIAIRIMRV
jgi:hypothetical protein